jgi:hypothetical protein
MANPITAIAYEQGTTKKQGGEPDKSIDPFNLDPLYWHVEPDGLGKARIIIDQAPPNSIKAVGPITQITIRYTSPLPGSSEQSITWIDPGFDFSGNQLSMYIKVIDVTSNPRSVLVLDDLATVKLRDPSSTDEDQPFITSLVIASAVTGGDERAYYVNIPVKNYEAAKSSGMKWTKHGGAAGPIGAVTVP